MINERRKYRTLYRQLEFLSKQLVKERSQGRCERCGSTSFCEWAHYISRRYLQVKFHVNNTFYLCKEHCHPYMDNHPIEFRDWVIDRIGEEKHNELILLKNRLFIRSVDYFEAQKQELLEAIQDKVMEW